MSKVNLFEQHMLSGLQTNLCVSAEIPGFPPSEPPAAWIMRSDSMGASLV